jgi:ferredoxin-nitrate reductase
LGEAKADWEIFAEVGRRLGFEREFSFTNSAEVYTEFVLLTCNRPCDMTGISHEQLQAEGATQWPHPQKKPELIYIDSDTGVLGFEEEGTRDWGLGTRKASPSAKRLYTDLRFHTPDGRARFGAYHSRGLAEPPDPDYPFVLTTGRLYGHWHTQTRTGRIEKIRSMHPEPFIEIHPRDAAQLNITDSEWVEVRSRRGKSKFPAKITKAIAPGTVFVPMHWGALWAENSEANALTHPESCPDSLQPELKACAVQLAPIARQEGERGKEKRVKGEEVIKMHA